VPAGAEAESDAASAGGYVAEAGIWMGSSGRMIMTPSSSAPMRSSTSATRAIYGRLDPIIATHDSVRVQMIVIDAGTGRVQLLFDGSWPIADLGNLARALARAKWAADDPIRPRWF